MKQSLEWRDLALLAIEPGDNKQNRESGLDGFLGITTTIMHG
jgi:hypothetical protein